MNLEEFAYKQYQKSVTRHGQLAQEISPIWWEECKQDWLDNMATVMNDLRNLMNGEIMQLMKESTSYLENKPNAQNRLKPINEIKGFIYDFTFTDSIDPGHVPQVLIQVLPYGVISPCPKGSMVKMAIYKKENEGDR